MPMTEKSVLIVSGTEKGAKLVSGILEPGEFSPVLCVSSAGEAQRLLSQTSFDVIVINTPLKDEFGIDFALNASQDTFAGIMLIVRAEMFDQTAYKVENSGVFTVSKPNSSRMFYQCIRLAVAVRERLRSVEKKNQSLQAKMDEIRIVNRAKWVLIKRLNMDENDAHRYIEKQAMDMRVPRRVIADDIIKMYSD